LYSSDTFEKVRRKRVLLSSDYRTALKVKQIYDVYFELNQSHWVTEPVLCTSFKRFCNKTLIELQNKYECGVVYKTAPTPKKGIAETVLKRQQKSYYGYDDELDEDEE